MSKFMLPKKPSKEQMAKLLAKYKWHIQGFNGTPLYLLCAASRTGWMTKEVFGRNYTHFYYLCPPKRVLMYYDEKDWDVLGELYYKRFVSIKKQKAIERQYSKIYANTVKAAKKTVKKTPLSDMPIDGLIMHILKCCDCLANSVGIAHIVEAVSFSSEKKINRILEKKLALSQNNLSLLSSPVYPSFSSKAQAFLWKIKLSQGKRQISLINKFLEKYFWLENSYIEAKALEPKNVLVKAMQATRPGKANFKKIRKQKNKLMDKLRFSGAERLVVKIIEETTRWQDERKENILKALSLLEGPIQELANRLNLEPQELKCIIPEEINVKNLSDKRFLRELKSRHKGCALYSLPKKTFVFTGADYEHLLKAKTSQSRQATELTGLIAYKGSIIGKARICQDLEAIKKIKPGEILIASMTRPEYLPAMHKAAAIVTDEGGITSHAAIVSRELKKPCIIGTKVATKVLKDGDLIEVDANKGIVKIISRYGKR